MNIETIWAIAGLLLIIADLMFGTFFMLFLGLGALITAGFCWMGIADHNTGWQWLIFSAASTLGLALFRKKLISAFGKDAANKYEEHAGNIVTVTVDIPAKDIGRVKYKGAEWPAKTVSGEALMAGSKAKIDSTDGIVLHIIPD